jgi:rod shape-determining protein MreD
MQKKKLAIVSITLLIIIGSVFIPPSGYSFLSPSFSIAGVIYWIIKKEYPLNNYLIFFFGLLNDLLIGTPLGSSSLFYFIVKESIFLLEVRLKKSGMITDFVKYIFGLSIYFSSIYIFTIIYFANFPSINYFLMSYLLTLFIFPVIYITLNWIESKMRKDRT